MSKSKHTRKGVVRKHTTRTVCKKWGFRVHKTTVKKY